METFGSFIKAHREKRGIRLEEIASITKIHIHTLQHMENDQWSKLPPEPFVRGFIVAYAKYVGIDPKEAIDKYLSDTNGENTGSHLVPPQESARKHTETAGDIIGKKRSISTRKIALFAGVFALLALTMTIVWVGKTNTSDPYAIEEEETEEEVSESEPAIVTEDSAPEQDTTPTVEEPEVAVAEPEPEPKPAPKPVVEAPTKTEKTPSKPIVASNEVMGPEPAPEVEPEKAPEPEPTAKATKTRPPMSVLVPAAGFEHKVYIMGNKRSWTKLVLDDEPPREYFLREGGIVSYQAREKVKIIMGNTKGVRIFHNGQLAEGVEIKPGIRKYSFPADATFEQEKDSPEEN